MPSATPSSLASTQDGYTKMPLYSNGCASGHPVVVGDVACRAAATSLGLEYGGSSHDSGAPSGCFYLTDDGGMASQVKWNTRDDQMGWRDAGSVCRAMVEAQTPSATPSSLASTQDGYTKMPLYSNGCASGHPVVIGEVACKAAATSLGLEYGGSSHDSGAPSGCFYLTDDGGMASEVRWNTR